jgi:hypothetical protein
LLALKLLVKDLQHHVARSIIGVASAVSAIGTEASAVELALTVPIKRDTHAL